MCPKRKYGSVTVDSLLLEKLQEMRKARGMKHVTELIVEMTEIYEQLYRKVLEESEELFSPEVLEKITQQGWKRVVYELMMKKIKN